MFAAWDKGDGTLAFLISGTLANVFDVWVKTAVGSGDMALTSSELSQTPLPAALPLFAGGLGALGLLGWRRMKKAAASAV